MSITTLSSRDFNQDTGRAKAAARSGPVFITDRGRPAYVLLAIEDYKQLSGDQPNIVDMLGYPASVEDLELDLPRDRGHARSADLG